MEADAVEENACSTMWSGLQWLALTPAGLESRRQGVLYKLHAILHQLYLVAGSPAQLSALVKSISVWTWDLGVETGVVKVPPVAFGNLFPYFLPVAVPPEEEAQWEAAHEQLIDMSSATVVPGFMHVISNMVKGFLDVLPQWQDRFGPLASQLATYLRHSWTRERFVVTCLVGEFEQFRPLYKTFKGDLTRWRWGEDRLFFEHNARESSEQKLADEAIGNDLLEDDSSSEPDCWQFV